MSNRTLVVPGAPLIRNTESKFTLFSASTVVICSTFRRWYRRTHTSDTTKACSAFLITLTSVWRSTDIIYALQIRKRTVACILAEEGRHTTTCDAAEFSIAFRIITADDDDAIALVATLAVATIVIIEAIGSWKTNARRVGAEFALITIRIDIASL